MPGSEGPVDGRPLRRRYTCAHLYFTGSKRLKLALKEKIDETRARNGRLLVPTIVLAEALDIAEKGRVQFDFAEMHRLIREKQEFEIVGLSPEIFNAVVQVQNIPELHDRIIVAQPASMVRGF